MCPVVTGTGAGGQRWERHWHLTKWFKLTLIFRGLRAEWKEIPLTNRNWREKGRWGGALWVLRIFLRKLAVNQSWKMDRHQEMAVLSSRFYQSRACHTCPWQISHACGSRTPIVFPSHAWRPKQRSWGLGKQRSFGLCPVNIHDQNDNHHDFGIYLHPSNTRVTWPISYLTVDPSSAHETSQGVLGWVCVQ